MVPVRASVAAASDIGRHRERNEDSFAIADQLGLYVVADGMGGHRAGSVASRVATESIVEFFTKSVAPDFDWPFHLDPRLTRAENRLLSAVRVANREVFEQGRQKRDWEGMGTTVVVAYLDSARVLIAHVGDSRAYRIRGATIQQLTRDHSLASEMRLRAADPRTADSLPKNILTRALGSSATSVVDLSDEVAAPGDIYLLCSDGLTGCLSDSEICEVVCREPSLERACQRLVEAANENGGDDNVTVLVVRIENDNDGALAGPDSELESRSRARSARLRETARPNQPHFARVAEVSTLIAEAARRGDMSALEDLYAALSALIKSRANDLR